MTMVSTLLRQFRGSLQIKKGYHKCSSAVAACWITKIYQSIAVKKGQLFTYYDTTGVAKKASEVL